MADSKEKKIILGFVILTLLFFISYFLNKSFLHDKIIEISIISYVIFCILYNIILIQSMFHSLLLTEPSKTNGYFHAIHLIYVLLPIGLLWQAGIDDQILLMVVLTQIISIINLFILHIRSKYLIKKHIKNLRYSNKFMSGVSLFVITLICYFEGSLNSVLTFLFLLPLVGLDILYERVDILVEEET